MQSSAAPSILSKSNNSSFSFTVKLHGKKLAESERIRIIELLVRILDLSGKIALKNPQREFSVLITPAADGKNPSRFYFGTKVFVQQQTWPKYRKNEKKFENIKITIKIIITLKKTIKNPEKYKIDLWLRPRDHQEALAENARLHRAHFDRCEAGAADGEPGLGASRGAGVRPLRRYGLCARGRGCARRAGGGRWHRHARTQRRRGLRRVEQQPPVRAAAARASARRREDAAFPRAAFWRHRVRPSLREQGGRVDCREH